MLMKVLMLLIPIPDNQIFPIITIFISMLVLLLKEIPFRNIQATYHAAFRKNLIILRFSDIKPFLLHVIPGAYRIESWDLPGNSE